MIFRLKVTTASSKVKSMSHHDVAHLHPKAMSLPNTNNLLLKVSEIQPKQAFSQIPPIRTPWVKTIQVEPLKTVGVKKWHKVIPRNYNTNLQSVIFCLTGYWTKLHINTKFCPCWSTHIYLMGYAVSYC